MKTDNTLFYIDADFHLTQRKDKIFDLEWEKYAFVISKAV